MRVIDHDDQFVTVEIREPKWTVEEVELRHQLRCLQELVAAGLVPELGCETNQEYWNEDRTSFDPVTQSYVNRPGITHEAGQLLNQLSVEARDRIGRELAGDHRERLGLDRASARSLERTVVQFKLEKLADQFGIPTNVPMTDWRKLTLDAVKAAPARGTVGEEEPRV
jgi:hypothetical protein